MSLRVILIVIAVAVQAQAQSPPPGAESGRVDDQVEPDPPGRVVARNLFFIPRNLLEVLMLPIRGTIEVNERYKVTSRLRELFYNEAGTIGLYPTINFDSINGLLVGAQLEAWLTPDNNRLVVFAGVGPRSRRRAGALFRSLGHADGRVGFTLYADYERRPEARFYGIGDADEEPPPPMRINALAGDMAALSFYTDRLARAAQIVDVLIADNLYVDVSGAILDRETSNSSHNPTIEEVFQPSSIVAFNDYSESYGELGLRYDTRGPRSEWQPRMLISQGSLAAVWGGRALVDPTPSFWRYGIDLQHFIPIGAGPRVLSIRFHGEAISAEIDEVPFSELPALGGNVWLRGYQTDRFRDRVAATAALEYQWGLSRTIYASLFADVGRVYPGFDELTLDGMRLGYGFALEAHSTRSLFARVSIASSIDGGVFFDFYVDPVSDLQPRVRRR